MTRETVMFLLDLLGRQQLNVGAPDFDEAVAAVLRAKTELNAALTRMGQEDA